ncbi:hypothetical protein DL96DRAFT_588639 [Flagelloscypha sp. PMI_526]|nr:hypothetical protein DL96DRAFT_588639 [Flagelloscypha sp. PMI_526]
MGSDPESLTYVALNGAFMSDGYFPSPIGDNSRYDTVTHLKWYDSSFPLPHFAAMIEFFPKLTHFLVLIVKEDPISPSGKFIALAEFLGHLKVFIVAPYGCPEFDDNAVSFYPNTVVMTPFDLFHLELSLARFKEIIGGNENEVWRREERIMCEREKSAGRFVRA